MRAAAGFDLGPALGTVNRVRALDAASGRALAGPPLGRPKMAKQEGERSGRSR